MDTLEFLYRWKYSHLDPEHCSAWAEHLIREGHETEGVLILLGTPDMQWSERDHYIRQILRELDIGEPNAEDMFQHQERLLILRYLAGGITARELTAAGEKIWITSGYNSTYVVWAYLDEDFWNLSLDPSDAYRYFTCLDPKDVDGSLKACLGKEGKLRFLKDGKRML